MHWIYKRGLKQKIEVLFLSSWLKYLPFKNTKYYLDLTQLGIPQVELIEHDCVDEITQYFITF